MSTDSGACGDPKCYVLHNDPTNPIHPPWYVDSRTAHVCPEAARPDEHGCRLNDGTPATGPHTCWHCHDDPPRGHTCPCCGALPRLLNVMDFAAMYERQSSDESSLSAAEQQRITPQPTTGSTPSPLSERTK